MIQSFKQLAAALCLLTASTIPVTAQVFTTPSAHAFPFGSNAVGFDAKVTTSYSKRDFNTSFGMTDMYLSSWGNNNPGNPSELIYLFSAPTNPMVMLDQGTIPYNDVADLGVGMIFDATIGQHVALVCYYDHTGAYHPWGMPGHVLDLYTINGPMGSPLILFNRIPLSTSPQYGRIRMDSHIEYASAIVWENPGVGIETIVSSNGNWSGITTLIGTASEIGPDVAFSHVSNLDVNFVYKDPAAGTITKSSLDWNTLLSVPFSSTASMFPNVQDVDGIPFATSELVLDCPDHYDVDNWAYTYTDGKRVYVRHMDLHSIGMPITTIVNDGSLGNFPLTAFQVAFNPTLHYGDRAITGNSGEITVGWNSSYGPTTHAESRYVAIEMKENGGGLYSFNDYMGIPNGQLGAHFNPAMSFSKMSDLMHPGAPQFLYTTYITQRTFSSGFTSFELQHAFHKWTNPVFKGVKPAILHPECGNQGHKVQPELVRSTARPNPFAHSLISPVDLKEDARVELALIDMAGRVVAQKAVQLNKGNHQVLMNELGTLPAGSYVLNTTINGVKTATQLMIKQ